MLAHVRQCMATMVIRMTMKMMMREMVILYLRTAIHDNDEDNYEKEQKIFGDDCKF